MVEIKIKMLPESRTNYRAKLKALNTLGSASRLLVKSKRERAIPGGNLSTCPLSYKRWKTLRISSHRSTEKRSRLISPLWWKKFSRLRT